MAAAKKVSGIRATGATVYAVVRREADGFRMNDADGSFASNPADPYLALAEDAVIAGLYEVSESRTVWPNGAYMVFLYDQAGGSPAPASDTLFDRQPIYINNDGIANMTSLIGESIAIGGLLARNDQLLGSMNSLLNHVRLMTTALEKRMALKI